jgi:hypothetical protein
MVVYALGRWVLKPEHLGGWFVHDYLNDVICLPLFLPIILGIQRRLRIRRHDLPPTLFEVAHNWVVFSVLFELILPRLRCFDSIADPWDAVAYLIGGIGACVWWNRRTRTARVDAALRRQRAPIADHAITSSSRLLTRS